MNARHQLRLCCVALMAIFTIADIAGAQEEQRGRGRGFPGGGQRGFGGFRGGFGGGGGNGDLLGLLRVEEVQKELELIEEQTAQVRELAASGRGPGRGGGRGNFQDLSEEERQERFAQMQREREARAQEAATKLADILLPHQMGRLKEIQLQQLGARALQDKEVAAALQLTDDQTTEITKVTEENNRSMRDQMRELFQGGFGEETREKMQAIRKAADEKVLAVLTESQQQQFTEMKGAAFDMPAPNFRGGRGFGGRRGGGGEGRRGGSGAGRPQRPEA